MLYIIVYYDIMPLEAHVMKLCFNKNSKDPIYYIQVGVRNGKKVTTKNVYKIGKHSELLKITKDPLAYAKQEVIKYNEKLKKEKVPMQLNVDFSEKLSPTNDTVSLSTSRNIGYFVFQKIYHDLDIKSFIQNIQKDTKISFDCNDVNRFLTFARILDPGSKLKTVKELHNYYETPSFSHQNILRFMDILDEHFNDYIEYLYKQSSNLIKRDTTVLYYDCTNFYNEIETADEDYTDPITGEVLKGLRQYGVSKENRPNPVVEMGLIVDRDGIPVSMCIHPGNKSEQTTAIPLEEDIIQNFGVKKFIYCADAGLGSMNIRKFNNMADRAFIVTQSIKKMSNEFKELIFKDENYKLLSNDKKASLSKMKTFDIEEPKNISLYNDTIYKVLPADKAVDLGLYETKVLNNGKVKKVKSKGTIHQIVIVTYSRKYAEYQKDVRTRQVNRAKTIIENAIDPESIKKGPNDVRRFIKKKDNTKKTEYIIDENRISEEEKYDGFYAVATNLDDKAQDILAVSHKRYIIEDRFRIIKSNLEGRPLFHRLPERIQAHFLICYTALLFISLLQAILDKKGNHFTVDEIITTIKNMEVHNNQDLFYDATYTGSKVCTAFNETFDLNLDKKHYRITTLSKLIKSLQ